MESRIYETWEKNGCFKGRRDPKRKPFTIVMPPPMSTGQLHMGHALDNTLQDILIRYKNMKRIYGYKMKEYWSNIASVDSYYQTNMDFLNRKSEITSLKKNREFSRKWMIFHLQNIMQDQT